MAVYFEKTGKENTEKTCQLALDRARQLGIKHIVVASNSGYTARFLADKGIHVVCVTHHVGFKKPGYDEMGQETRKELRSLGMDVLTTTHLFGNVERAITHNFGGLYPGGIIANTLRMFSQGTKVAVEIAVMALDAGLIPYGEPCISCGGSGGGADSALVLIPAHAKDIFETKILELIAKPRDPEEKNNP